MQIIEKHRQQHGLSMIVLVAWLGLMVIPIIGLFAFEVNRYQQLQRQLERIVDATALSGGRRLVEADVTGAEGNIDLAAQFRHWQAMNSAYAFITSQEADHPLHTINSVGLNAHEGTPGYLAPWFEVAPPPVPHGANQGVVQIVPCDPSDNYRVVPPGDIKGRAIHVSAVYNVVPAFGKFLGLGYVPISTHSSSSLPSIDVLVCLDVSGSMDDCTRMTLVNQTIQETPNGINSLIALGPPPPEPDYSPCATLCGAPQHDCQMVIYNNYSPLYDSWAAQMQKTRDDNLMLAYLPVAQGRLRDLVTAAGAQVTDEGTQINVIPLTHSYFMESPFISEDFYRWLDYQRAPLISGTTDGPTQTQSTNEHPNCAGWMWHYNPVARNYVFNGDAAKKVYNFGWDYVGFNDFVANVGPICNSPAPQPKWGPYNPGAYTPNPSAPFAFDGFTFDKLPTLVEAAEGNLEAAGAWKSKIDEIEHKVMGTTTGKLYDNTVAFLGGELPARAGYQKAYQDASRQVMQPYGAALAATQSFINTLVGSGKNVRVGLVTFASDTEHSLGSPLPAPNTVQEAMVSDRPPAGFQPEPPQPLVSVGLTSSSNTAGIQEISRQLMRTAPLDGTNIGQGLKDCHDILEASRGGRPRLPVVVLITDGINNNPAIDPISLVKGWSNNNIPVYCIGLNQQSDPDFIAAMQQQLGDGRHGSGQGIAYWAGNGSQYYQAPNPGALRNSLSKIARRIVALSQ